MKNKGSGDKIELFSESGESRGYYSKMKQFDIKKMESYNSSMGSSHTVRSIHISDDKLLKISSANPGMRFERVEGELIAMTPVGEHSAFLESEYLGLVRDWSKKNSAQTYGSSSGFKLPNENVRSPDVAVLLSTNPFFGKRLESFIPGAPDFLIEIRSKTDSFSLLKAKMVEWIENGSKLAFLIDPVDRRVYVYRKDVSVTEYPYSARLTGEDVLPGFSVCPEEVDPK